LASGSEDKTIILWDVASQKPLGQPLTGHPDSVESVVFTPDGKTLASGGFRKKICDSCREEEIHLEGEINLWDVASRQSLGQPLTSHTGSMESVAFSPDGKTLASGGCGVKFYVLCLKGEIHLWDVASRQPLGQLFSGTTGSVQRVAFSPDSKTLASGSA